MNMANQNVIVERVSEYSPEVAEGIGRLMPDLSERMSAEPIDEQILRDIIDSPDREQLIARMHGRIVGAATLNTLLGPAAGRKAWLEDFVVSSDESVRGTGVGYLIWQEMISWCQEQGKPLNFSSHPSREKAHEFYLRNGAEIRETTVFTVQLPVTE